EVLAIGVGQGQVAGVAVDAGGGVLVITAAEGRVAGAGDHAPDLVLRGVVVLPAGNGKAGEMGDHLQGGIVVDVAAPGVAGAQQFLVGVLDALIEAADGRLEDVVGAAG